jgi:sortase A
MKRAVTMFRWFERVLWFVAVLALTIYGLSQSELWLYQTYFNWEFARSLEIPARAAPPEHPVPYTMQPLGRLEIPSIALSAIFIEGVDSKTLRRGIGHVPGTALPGMPGNVSLSAHRDTFFRRLGKIHEGDAISITTLDATYEYVVESTGIVDPDERAVLRDIGRPTLTLVTCYPFYYVGSAPRRFVVHASLRKS